jgi:NitT/TauT family transport system ATP-binding protein
MDKKFKQMKKIIVENLFVRKDDKNILIDINFEVPENLFISILGKSGSGKTTLLNSISGFIDYKGKVLKPKKIGNVFQKLALYPWMNTYENIEFATIEDDNKNKNDLINEYLDIADLSSKKYAYPNELSGGQAQRVAIVRSMIHNPDVLLMDEPFSSLDEHTRFKMQKWLLEVWSKFKKTIIFVTHNIDEAIYLSDRILILDNGSLIADIKTDLTNGQKLDKHSLEYQNLKRNLRNISTLNSVL